MGSVRETHVPTLSAPLFAPASSSAGKRIDLSGMAFRKRSVVVGRSSGAHSATSVAVVSGVKPSPLTSHPVTSTGTPSLDDMLGGHSGLPLGSSLLVEESGTTDFAGALLRFYAAEGICQGHIVHVVGVGDGWIRDLPGRADEKGSRKSAAADADEKMKIAWRYERLGQTGERALPDHSVSGQASPVEHAPFSHSFDLSKRLAVPTNARINSILIRPSPRPFDSVLQTLTQVLKSAPPESIHRLVIPTVLSPALWPPTASRPEHFLSFLHSLRTLLAQYPARMTAMITLPLELYLRSSGLVRWAELLCDGVLELTPFPHLIDASSSFNESGSANNNDDQPQGMLKVQKLPINTERGEGGAGASNSMGEDLAFTVSRRKFSIRPFFLPPMEGDQAAQKEVGKLTGKDVEF